MCASRHAVHPSAFANFTRSALPGVPLPTDWRLTVYSAHCRPTTTLRYEIDDIRAAISLVNLWHEVNSGKSGLFVDVGANCGIYSLIMASLGHTCLAIDPLPTCVDDIRASARRNGFGPGQLQVVRRGVSYQGKN